MGVCRTVIVLVRFSRATMSHHDTFDLIDVAEYPRRGPKQFWRRIVLRCRMPSGSKRSKPRQAVSDSEYRALSDFRQSIHDYLDFSDRAARLAGLEPRQYQLLLAIKGLPDGTEPTVGTLAARLRVRHHSAVELIDRAESNGYVRRERSGDGRYVLVQLTALGLRHLERAVAERLEELQSAGPELVTALRRLLRSNDRPRASSKKSRR